MANFKGQEDPTVGISSEPTPYLRDASSPAAFGVGLGKAVEGLGQEVGDIAANQRRLKATFDATDKELQYGEKQDQEVQNYKNELKALQPSENVSYQDAVAGLRDTYAQKLVKMRDEMGGSLSDPLARKSFEIRTRLQTQAAMRHMMVTGDNEISRWRDATVQQAVESGIKRSGNVTGDIDTDLQNIQVQALTTSKAMEEYEKSMGTPPAAIRKKIDNAEGAMVNEALKGYGSNYQAGFQFLASKMPGTDLSIGFNPSKPDQESILNGAQTQAWIHHFTSHKQEKVGASLGAAWYLGGVRDPEKAAKEYVARGGEPAEAAKGIQQFTSLTSEAHTRQDIAIANTYTSLYKTISQKYDGDVEKALRSEDEDVKRQWLALGPKQANLRMAFAKEERLDPAAYGPLGKVIDLSGTPGLLQKTYPTAEQFAAEFQGPTKHLWPQALQMYEHDIKRDTSQDVHYQAFKADVESRSRVLAGWQRNGDPRRATWDYADERQNSIHTWVTSMSEQAWAEHMQARKQTPGKTSDVFWYKDTLSQIMQEAGRLDKNKSFKSGAMPEAMPTPASAVTIRQQSGIPTMTQEEYDKAPVGTAYRKTGETIIRVKRQ